jgi:uncharacterized membrane protein
MWVARRPPMQAESTSHHTPRLSRVDRAWDEFSSDDRGAVPRRSAPHQGFETNGESLRGSSQRRARLLGFFSLGLGLAQLTLTGEVARLLGLGNTARNRAALRLVGAREVVSGVALLARSDSAGPVWSRLAGDVVDLGLVGAALRGRPASRARLLLTGGAIAGVAVLDALSAAALSRNERVQKLVLPIHVVRSITIKRPPEEVYRFWRALENLPQFMAHLASVEQMQDGSSRWRAHAPFGLQVEWTAEVTLDRPGEALAWRSLEGASVPNRGVVRFTPAPGGRGTEVCVELKYDPPSGALASAIAKLFGEEPGQQIAGDLRRLKQVLETGGVVHSDASIHRGLHAARPPADDEKPTMIGSEVRT